MISYAESNVLQVSVHRVGNRVNDEALELSSEPLDNIKEDRLQKLLLRYCLSHFTLTGFQNFVSHHGDVSSNPIFKFASSIFSNRKSFHKNSVNIAKHLYDSTPNPTIKSGDLFVTYLSNIIIDDNLVDAIGIFKSENKESYLKLSSSSHAFLLEADHGLNVNKLDKGCLILNANSETGFKVLAVDNATKADATFWIQDFLQIEPSSDAFHRTRNFMNLTRQYVEDQMAEEFTVSKADKIDLLNRSMNFFKKRNQFNQPEFEAEVLEDASVIESFRNYERVVMSTNEEDIVDNFEISAQAVKKQIRVFKSVLKLDKNFHIYIHGNKQLIEKGFDKTLNKHYYKLFFDEES